jgi:hypothetical protein
MARSRGVKAGGAAELTAEMADIADTFFLAFENRF